MKARLSRWELETSIPGCTLIPHRYMVALMAAFAALISVGTRACFALIMTHLTAGNKEERITVIFPKCTALNTTLDLAGDASFMLHNAYYTAFTLLMIPGSLLSTLFSTKLVAGVSVLVYSIATLALPYAIPVSLPLLFLLRITHGLMEACQNPAMMALVAAWSTEHEKARLFGILATGIYTAPALASVLAASTICFVSWDSILYIYGCAGIVWTSFWVHSFHDTPEQHPDLTTAEAQYLRQHGHRVKKSSIQVFLSVPWKEMLKSRGVWAVFLGSFSRNLVFAILVLEQPQYFLDAFHIHAEDIGIMATVPYVGLGAAAMIGGSLSDKLITMGVDRTTVRRIVYSISYSIEGCCLVALFFVNDWKLAFGISCSGIAIGGMAVSAYAPLPSDMAPQYTSIISGLGMTGTLGGVLSTALASAIPGKSKTLASWQIIFLITGMLHLASALLFVFMVDAKLQPWAEGIPRKPLTSNRNNSALAELDSEGQFDCSETTPLTESSDDSNNDESNQIHVYKAIDGATYQKLPS